MLASFAYQLSFREPSLRSMNKGQKLPQQRPWSWCSARSVSGPSLNAINLFFTSSMTTSLASFSLLAVLQIRWKIEVFLFEKNFYFHSKCLKICLIERCCMIFVPFKCAAIIGISIFVLQTLKKVFFSKHLWLHLKFDSYTQCRAYNITLLTLHTIPKLCLLMSFDVCSFTWK